MKKIPTIFKRDPLDMSQLTRDWHPDCLWVLNGEGVATRKYDGTCCLVHDGGLYKRREVKKGKAAPNDFWLVSTDEHTGKSVGWLPVSGTNPDDKYHQMAYTKSLKDGTYELVGEKVQGGKEGSEYRLISHADAFRYDHCPTDYDDLRQWLHLQSGEGVVWHHPDGRMAKIKKRDFGIKW